MNYKYLYYIIRYINILRKDCIMTVTLYICMNLRFQYLIYNV